MRKLIVSTVFAAAMLVGACKEPDPNRFETHIERIKDSSKRAQGFTGLESLTKTVVTARDNDDLIQEFADKVVPVFEEVWDDAEEQQTKMLELLRDVAHPAGSRLWNKALELDGSTDARNKALLALEGIKKARALDSQEAVIEQLGKLIEDPRNDSGEKVEGDVRKEMVDVLGALGDKAAVPILIKSLEQPPDKQPVKVHRAAVVSLGLIGDPSATDALVTVPFRVPDVLTTTNIGEKAKVALVGIGEPAVPTVLQMLRGEHSEVQKLAAEVARKSGGEQTVGQRLVQQMAAGMLGTMGVKSAVDDLIKIMPKEDCVPEDAKKKKEGATIDPEAGTARGIVANALGLLGDPKAAEPLCKCVNATKNPGDMYPIIEALGRVGGPKAVECLVQTIKTGEYDDEAVDDKSKKLEPRWEAARFAVLAARPGDVANIRAAIDANPNPIVKKEMAPWDAGLKVLDSCKDDKACYVKTLGDVNADWFAREKAAFEVARLGAGDPKMALAVAEAFKVRNPDARVSVALLAPRMLDGKKCQECVDAIDKVLSAEKDSMDKHYQLSVLTARATRAKLRVKQKGRALGEAPEAEGGG